MHAEQKSFCRNLRQGAEFKLFSGTNAAFKTAGCYLLFHSQTAVTNERAKIGNQGIARSINPANVASVRAPATS
jgi:hypothetical protein